MVFFEEKVPWKFDIFSWPIPDLVFKRHFENKKDEIIVRLTVHACVAWVQTSSFLGPIYIYKSFFGVPQQMQ